MKKLKLPKPRNPNAIALQCKIFAKKVVPNKKVYNRKKSRKNYCD